VVCEEIAHTTRVKEAIADKHFANIYTRREIGKEVVVSILEITIQPTAITDKQLFPKWK